MTNSQDNDDFTRITIRLHKILKQKIFDYQKEELYPTLTHAMIDLLKKGLEKVKDEKKKW